MRLSRAIMLGGVAGLVSCTDSVIPPWLTGDWRLRSTCCPLLFQWPPSPTVLSFDSTGMATLRDGNITVMQTSFLLQGTGSVQLTFREPIPLPYGCSGSVYIAAARPMVDTLRLSDMSPRCDDAATQWELVRDP